MDTNEGADYAQWVEAFERGQLSPPAANMSGNVSQLATSSAHVYFSPTQAFTPGLNTGIGPSSFESDLIFGSAPSALVHGSTYVPEFFQGRSGIPFSPVFRPDLVPSVNRQTQYISPVPETYSTVQTAQATMPSSTLSVYSSAAPFQLQSPPLGLVTNTADPQSTFTFAHQPPPAPSTFSSPGPALSSSSGPSESRQTSPPTQAASSSRASSAHPIANKDGSSAKPRGKGRAKKRKRIQSPEDVDSEDEDEDYGTSYPGPPDGPSAILTRRPGACAHCKKLKMKCDFPPGENTCKRCKHTGRHCIVEGRKPRHTPNQREILLGQIRQKDAVIESLLRQLYQLAKTPANHDPSSEVDANAWLERLTTSGLDSSGRPRGSAAFGLESRAVVQTDDSEKPSTVTEDELGGQVAEQSESGGENNIGDQAPDDAIPIGLIANLSLSNSKGDDDKNSEADNGVADEDNIGWANQKYFKTGPATDISFRQQVDLKNTPPDIVAHGLVTPVDVEKLFNIYFTRMNVHVTLLDPVLHTPATIFSCPFLFTVVCAIASRYYTEKSEIYPVAMRFVKHAAANALISGRRSIELAQAYLLLAYYAEPAKRWEEHRAWLYIGLGQRLAMDLGLYQVSTVKPTNERQERELLNRVRVWLSCYNLDRTSAAHYGRPHTLKEDFIVRKSANWYLQSKYNGPLDIGLCAYTAMLRIVSRFHDEIYSDPNASTGLNQNLNFLEITMTFDDHLNNNFNEWDERFANFKYQYQSDPHRTFRRDLLPFLLGYARLVMYSFGFQQAFKRGMQDRDQIFLDKCYENAATVVNTMTEKLAPSGYMRYSSDGHFIFATFASAFLLKLLRPEFAKLLTKEQQDDIFDLVERLIHAFSSVEVAIDDRHTPRLHARFLSELLSKHRKDVSSARTAAAQPRTRPTTQGSAVPPDSDMSQESSDAGQPQTLPGSQILPQGGIGYPSAPAPMEGAQAVPDLDVPMSFDDELLGALQVFKNPGYWESMMMPGFQWPERDKSAYPEGIPGIEVGYGDPQMPGSQQ